MIQHLVRDRECRKRADIAPTTVASGRTGVRTKAVIDYERQISLHHPAETYVTEHLYCLPKVSSKE